MKLHFVDRECRGETSGRIGFIESPNWPGHYPPNVDCVWKITAEKGRRILIIVPEIRLADPSEDGGHDECKDSLVMRKSGK